MADPSEALTAAFQRALGTAFGPEHAGDDPIVRPSNQSGADYQANAAMSLAKQLGRPPRDVAAELVAALDLGHVAGPPEIAGPGFVNVVLADEWIASQVETVATDDRVGVAVADPAEVVVVDYSAPNVAKEMHVGHLRSSIIGDALARILEFLGHRVIRQNHIGEWGTPFGMLIEHLLDVGEDAAATELSVGDLTAFYQQARAKFDTDPAFADRARARVVQLQGGDDETLRLWHVLVDESKKYFAAVYDRLGVLLTDEDTAGESFYNPWLTEVADELEAAGLARIDDGALCAFPPGFANREGEPMALMVRKSDGGFGYQATDLAALRYRTNDLGATRILYVVGAPQAQHLAMVMAVGEQASWLGAGARAEHVSFGSILGDDRKMLKTRAGDSPKLSDLLDEAVERALAVVRDKSSDLDADEQRRVAEMVGIGAVKYADLSNDRIKDYVFDWDRMLAFEGNTGPYLQYAHARIRSIFRRGEVDADSVRGAPVVLGEPEERALALMLLRFDGSVRATAESAQPHRLCGYLFDLAQAFTAFYERVPVLRTDTAEQRSSRLVLCDLTARVLATGLGLLGIQVPDRM